MSLGTLVLVAPCCLFCTTRHWIYCWFDIDDMVFAITLNWYHTHRIHRDQYTYTHTYKYVLTSPVTCAQQLSVLQWMNNFLIQKFTLQISTMFYCSKITHLYVKIMDLLIRLSKTKLFLWMIKNTNRNCINGQWWL